MQAVRPALAVVMSVALVMLVMLILPGGAACEQGRSAAQRWKEQSTLWDGAWEGCVGRAAAARAIVAGQQQQLDWGQARRPGWRADGFSAQRLQCSRAWRCD